MIWTLRIECVRGLYLEDEWVRTIEADSHTTLLELHETIQDMVEFDRDHLFMFFAGRHCHHRKLVYGEGDDWEEWEDAYARTTLEQLYPLPKSCKLHYLFDFGDNWCFEIRRGRKKPFEPVAGVDYPRVIDAVGPNPEQYGSWDE